MSALTEAAAYWNKRAATPLTPRTRWWQSETIIRHINKVVGGEPIPGVHAAFHERLRSLAPPGGYRRAISVGCGTGQKEAGLVLSGLVHEFRLYEISSERIRQGEANAKARGISDKMIFREADAFGADVGEPFDLVYWNNSLHHMPNTPAAIQWSLDTLAPGGIFGMDDFVGPSRFQWTDASLRHASDFRQALLPRHLKHPSDPERLISQQVPRPKLEKMMEIDPSEAADSDRILPAVRLSFPDAAITLTGGVIYHLGLNDVLANMDDAEDGPLLQTALMLDQALASAGETHYAVATARKPL